MKLAQIVVTNTNPDQYKPLKALKPRILAYTGSLVEQQKEELLEEVFQELGQICELRPSFFKQNTQQLIVLAQQSKLIATSTQSALMALPTKCVLDIVEMHRDLLNQQEIYVSVTKLVLECFQGYDSQDRE